MQNAEIYVFFIFGEILHLIYVKNQKRRKEIQRMSNVYQGSATTVISTKKEMKEATRNASKMLFIAGG